MNERADHNVLLLPWYVDKSEAEHCLLHRGGGRFGDRWAGGAVGVNRVVFTYVCTYDITRMENIKNPCLKKWGA